MKLAWWNRPLLRLAGLLIKLNFATCRVTSNRPAVYPKRCIAATWHRGAIFFLYYFRKLKPAILVSRSRDGELLAAYISQMGGIPVRGSSSRGGIASLKLILSALKSGSFNITATVADGPRGPRYIAKEGMIILAMKSGLPLYPIMWSCDRAWIFKKAWDRTMVPKPFSRIRVEFGEPIFYPPRLDKEQLEAARLHLQNVLEAMRMELDREAGHQDP